MQRRLLLSLLSIVLLAPYTVYAISVPWDRAAVGTINPLYILDTVKANIFTATSTTQSSIFPFASTTVTSANTLCLTADICRTTWPSTGLTTDPNWLVSGGFLSPTTTVPIAITATATSTFAGPLYVSNTGSLGNIPPYLRVGSTTPAGGYFTNNLIDAVDARNDFVAIDTNNNTSGTCATADFAAVNDIGTISSNFGDFGHTSSLFTGSGCANNPFTGFGSNSTYLFDPNGNMSFALASTSNASFQWFSGGYTAANQKMVLTNAGTLGIGTTTPSAGILAVNGLSYFSDAMGIGAVPKNLTTPNTLIVSTTTTVANATMINGAFTTSSATGVNNAMSITATYTGAGDINITGLNSTVTTQATVNCTQTINNGGCARNRYQITLNDIGHRAAAVAPITTKVQTQAGALSSTTIAADFNAETPGITAGNTIDNFYGLYVQGGVPAGGSSLLTNRYGVHADDLLGGMNQYSIDTAQSASTTCATCSYAFRATGTAPSYFAGNVGIGTSTPQAIFTSVAASSTVPTGTYTGLVHIIAGLENTAVKLFQVIDQWGHLITSGDTPSVSGGTSTVAGNDNNGTITVAGVLLTSVTLTFAHAWVTAPDCTMADSSTGITGAITSITTTQLVVGFSAGINSGTVWYQCSGHQ